MRQLRKKKKNNNIQQTCEQRPTLDDAFVSSSSSASTSLAFVLFLTRILCTVSIEVDVGYALSAHQISLGSPLGLSFRAEHSSNLTPNSHRTKSSELSSHQISVRAQLG